MTILAPKKNVIYNNLAIIWLITVLMLASAINKEDIYETLNFMLIPMVVPPTSNSACIPFYLADKIASSDNMVIVT